jgi:multidrug efflux pump
MKEFKPTSWAIDNRTSIFIVTVFLTIAGIMGYQSIPKESYPDIVIPTIIISTVYPGTSPQDMETLVTKPLEKQVKAISGVKKMTSNSLQDFSTVAVEFNTDVDIPQAKQKVKDAVDKAKRDLPNDLPADPTVNEIEFSEIPILFVNISGDFSLSKLKDYAELLKDDIEELKEITRVDLVGALDREIQINVDKYKMQAASIGWRDIESAISFENMTIAAGNVTMDGMTRSISVNGEFKDLETIRNLVINSASGAAVALKDIADVKDGYKTRESFARLNGKNVVTLSVVKRGGENLINASDKIKDIVAKRTAEDLPKELNVLITGDQSRATRTTLHDLINTIIIGFILVALILMFFMGATNAIFVAMAVPLSMFIAFLVLPSIDYTLNFIVLFAFLLGLGIVVDDAIVVIENTHRVLHEEEPDIIKAAKKAAGEIFIPVLSGTATTLAPFFPLVFWGGTIGKFMHFMPVTIIITLTASLVVAYLINPVFAVWFMKDEHLEAANADKNAPFLQKYRGMLITTAILVVFAMVCYLTGSIGFGNFSLFCLAFVFLYKFVLAAAVRGFQKKAWPAFQNFYGRFLSIALKSPWWMMTGMIGVFFLTYFIMSLRSPKVVFFPQGEPNFIYTYLKLPVGTDIETTDSIAKILEKRIYSVIGNDNPMVESVITNVAVGAAEDQFDVAAASHKAKVGVGFVEFSARNGALTSEYMDKIREATRGIPGAEVSVDQESNGPPTAKPISIEIQGEDLGDLISSSVGLKKFLDSLNIAGVEELKSDMVVSKPEVRISVDRGRAAREGISTAQIGTEFRTAILGKEASKLRDGNEEIPIVMRLQENQRENLNAVENLSINYRDMNMGGILRSVPMAAFADIKYGTTYGGIRRKNQERVITLGSNVLNGFNPNEVADKVKAAARLYNLPTGIQLDLVGQQVEQEEAASFLIRSLGISMMLILLILITQFNSIGRTAIILVEVLFAIVGVLLGLSVFNMDFSIVMMGIGIVALAGIVVRNGILLVEFTDELRKKGHATRESIIEAGKIRMTPVILTATATILGLLPLAVGFNIDFASLFTHGDPKIFFGGDSVAFWGPLSWTIIFGLSFATFLTLIILPVMYWLVYRNRKTV